MMMNAKTSTKTLVVVEGHVEKEEPGEWTKKDKVLYSPHIQCNLYDEPAYPEYMGSMA